MRAAANGNQNRPPTTICDTTHEAVADARSKAMVKHDKLVSRVKSEIITAEKLASIDRKEVVFAAVSSEAMVAAAGSGSGGHSEDNILTIRAEVVGCEAAVNEANQILTSVKAVKGSLLEEIIIIKPRLPDLGNDSDKGI